MEETPTIFDPMAEHAGYFYQQLRRQFPKLGNEEIISFFESMPGSARRAGSQGEIEHFVFHRRLLTLEQLERISEFIPPQHMGFIAWYQLRHQEKREQKFSFLKAFYQRVLEKSTFSAGPLLKEYDQIALEMVKDFPWQLTHPQHLDEMLTVSRYLTDPNLSLRLQKRALQEMLQLGVEKVEEVLFHDSRVHDYAAVEARERYLDERVSRPAELDKIKKDLVSRIESLGEKELDSFVLKEALMNALLRDKERLLKALLSTGKNDRQLKTYLAEEVLKGVYSFKHEAESAAYFDENKFTPHGEALVPPAVFEDLLYRLDYEGRALLAQQLLIGEEGVLLDEKSRKCSLQWFFDTFIEKPPTKASPAQQEQQTPGQQQAYTFLRRAFQAVAEEAEVSNLYFLVHPLMVERILGKPKRKMPWKEALQRAKRNLLRRSTFKTEEDAYYFREDLDEVVEITYDFIFGGEKEIYGEMEEDDEEGRLAGQGQIIAELNKRCAAYLPKTNQQTEKLPVIDFVKQLATKLGAPGVRFLQCLGIYVDLSPAMRAAFDDVYDNVKGQLKLSAFHTVSREWNVEKKGGNNFYGLEAFGQRIGGGSLVTVYKGKVEGKEVVFRVVNPNVLYRSTRVCQDLRKVFSVDEQLAKGLPVLDNIEQWIKEDVSFQGLRYEEQFRKDNHGFTAGAARNNGYEIIVPRIYRQGRKYLVEEYIPGDNLTQWDKLAAEQEMKGMKEIISLVVKNVFHQVQSGLVHGDIHVGNIRVTEDKKIAWLDRNYLLELAAEDRQFIAATYASPDPLETVATYLCSFPENEQVNQESLSREIGARIGGITTENGTKILSSIGLVVEELYKAGGRLPLKPMLLVKNALALERMVIRAGFTDFAEALSYRR